ncbi:hypothetical protein [Mesorhizobium sp.]|uniref:hypothetical protein n=1 Tax=Mesorhizobium sp. TaxID=1871066 RepID=UPI0025C0317B|nr:hypothetical protein [Mesorhizobium sp.]
MKAPISSLAASADQVDHRDVLKTPSQQADNQSLMACMFRADNPSVSLMLDI